MADDEDSFLYGGGGGGGGDEEGDQDAVPGQETANEVAPVTSGKSEGDGVVADKIGVVDAEEDDEDESDDEDGVQITIDREKIDEAVAKSSSQYQSFGKGSARLAQAPPGSASSAEKKGKFAVEDFDKVGTINGKEAHDYDYETLEEKPWRKPGADITDFFNYGFTETTWEAYCSRQRKMRLSESGAGLPGQLNTISTKSMQQQHLHSSNISTVGAPPTSSSAPQRLPTVLNRSVPPPSTQGSQATKDNEESSSGPAPIAVMTSDKRIYSKKVLENMDFSVPPPGLPPPGIPPPTRAAPAGAFDGPPPSHEMVEYPEDPFGHDYDSMYSGYEPTMESQWSAPPPAAVGGDAPPGDTSYEGCERDVWRDRRRSSRDLDRYERDRSDRKRRRSRSRSRESRYGRDRDRDRDREREKRRRERSRSRSPSRHKKSKKEKKERSEKLEKEDD